MSVMIAASLYFPVVVSLAFSLIDGVRDIALVFPRRLEFVSARQLIFLSLHIRSLLVIFLGRDVGWECGLACQNVE